MAQIVSPVTAACTRCGSTVDVVDRFRDYSTTRGPMAEHVVTRCQQCGQQHLLHLAAQSGRADAAQAGLGS